MERADFIRLVEQCEHQAGANPRWFRRKLRLWMSLGTFYMVLLFFLGLLGTLACLGLVALSIYQRTGFGCAFWVLVLVGVPSVLLVYGTLRALFVRMRPPPGKELRSREFPTLHEDVREICRQLNAPPIHRIVLNDYVGFAAVATAPSRWIFGRLQNSLLLDVSMMVTHSREAVKAIMAHEVGNVLGGDTRLSMKLAGVIGRWEAVMASIHTEGKEPLKLVIGFLDWYMPRLTARRLVLSRAQELLADTTISRVMDPTMAAKALIGTEIKQRAMEEAVQKKLREMAREKEAPPAGFYQLLRGILNELQTYGKADEWVTDALRIPTEYGDTHPALRDRLKAILGMEDLTPEKLRDTGCWPDLQRGDAAEHYLGAELDMILAEFNALWVDGVRESWSASHQLQEEDSKRREEIQQRMAASEGTPEEELEFAMILEREGDIDGAIARIESILQRDSDMQPAQFALGRILLDRNIHEGLKIFHNLVLRDARWGPDCHSLAYNFHLRNGAQEAAREAEKRYDESLKVMQEAEQERATLRRNDEFLPPNAPAEQVDKMVEALAKEKRVRRAWFLRKKVGILPQIDCHLLLVEYDTAWIFVTAASIQRVADRLAQEIPLPDDSWLWVNPFQQLRGLGKKVRKVTPKPLYDRREWKRRKKIESRPA